MMLASELPDFLDLGLIGQIYREIPGVAMSTFASKELDVFPNPKPSRDYTIRIESPEFTCLCPKTGQPDFATLELEYVPDDLCVELKSWKLYLWSYRDEGAFHEDVTNRILDDLVAAIQPRYARLTADFNVRGGVYTSITAEHHAEGWAPVTNRLH
jgi:7-cyano-7-deazaguanine reductase